ncbi:lipoteichoic acid synthase-like YqgS [Thalassobacillus devorans]|uniref:Lipoteichoic acid synthase-like YqgS n=1 Tax=Thalassobacillus devorans TaxID=279813 RepID=A0ABQ1NM81_9BACI|nr:LTA synthase family protein [Thalassobacillus devorans]NIK27578.1 phosphoglycerol transferase MdoB-like AlkP superfamily enzyme [Thalassobacillus devorans]GGC78848.1 lipoteichoic acid synthase-like YqgS [Thalassobacillus devorans]
MKDYKSLLKKGWLFFLVAVLFLWGKTYYALKTAFNLDIENSTQQFILGIAPISSILFFLGLSLLIPRRFRNKAFMTIYVLMTFVLFANVVYFRFFSDFITLPVLMQYKNFAELGGSAQALIHPMDIVYWIDVAILITWLVSRKVKPSIRFKKRTVAMLYAAVIGIAAVNLNLANQERPELLTRTFDRMKLVKLLGIYNYHIYDSVVTANASSKRVFADSDELTEVLNYVNGQQGKMGVQGEYFGKAKGKNVVLISLESTQNFVIDYKVNGQEVTPFLNDLKEDSYYFSNFYHNTGQGKTSDSEFLLDNSMYGMSRGAVFTTNANNEYNATPEIIKEEGYTPVSFHGNNDSFWNRDIMYKSLGYDHFFSKSEYDVNEENSVNYGLKDIPFFEQSMPMIKDLDKPYYAKFITLTHHYPFILNKDEDVMIDPAETGDGTVDRYFQTMRYQDEAVKKFMEMMKEQGEYEDTIFIMYGDHYGISDNHNRAMGDLMDKEIRTFEEAQFQEVPLIIHIPGEEGKEMKTVGSQVDLKPTILNLLGIESGNDVQFGVDLFAKDREDIAIFRDGTVVTDKYVYAAKDGTCYDKETEEEIDGEACAPLKEQAEKELEYSDKVVHGDLLRFLDQNQDIEEK